MSRTLALAAAFALILAGAAEAKQCRDTHGKFMKCHVAAAPKCRNITTKKFAKCSAAHTERMTVMPAGK